MPPGLFPALGFTRIAIGVGLVLNPKGIGKALGIDDASMEQAAWLARFTGGREIAIGMGTLLAWRRSEPMAGWIAAQSISDATDTIAFITVTAHGKVTPIRGWGMAAFAASGAVSEAVTAIALWRRSRSS